MKMVHMFWIVCLTVALSDSIQGVPCECYLTRQEGRYAECYCYNDFRIQWQLNDFVITNCSGSVCEPSTLPGYTFSCMESVCVMTISLFTFTTCDGSYWVKNRDSGEISKILDCSVWLYSPCSATCGNGTMGIMQIRNCSAWNDENCVAELLETVYCNEGDCPVCTLPEIPTNGFILPKFSNESYSINQTITMHCDIGYMLQGFTSRICENNGHWSGQVPKCILGTVQSGECSEDVDYRGTLWNITIAGQISTQYCTPGYYGTVSRMCDVDGTWLLPVDKCVREVFQNLNRTIEDIKKTPTEEQIEVVLNNLTANTEVENESSLQDGEIRLVTQMLGIIATASRNVTISVEQNKNFIKTASNLVDERNINSWNALAQAGSGNDAGADDIMKAVEEYADAIGSSSQPVNDTQINADNIVFSILNLRKTKLEDVKFPPIGLQKELKTSSFYSLPSRSLNGVNSVSSVYYKTMDKILPAYNNANRNSSDERSINSAVLALKLMPYQSHLLSPLTLNFEHLNGGFDNPICSYWNFTTKGWDSEGCKIISTSNTMTQCQCNHLTNFAILMSPYKQVVSQTLSTITLVGSIISIVLLVITLVAHVLLWRYVKSDRVFILMNLVVALSISYLLFIIGVEQTENKVACTTIAVALHYFLLLVFFTMLSVTVEISLSVLFVFKTRQRRSVVLLPVAWGVPIVVVAVSASLSSLHGYGTSTYCWLSIQDGLIWAFVGPAIFVISINAILLVAILKKMFSTRFMAQKSGREKMKATMRSLCVLLPVMGITWIVGVFYISEDTQWIQYLFAVCNSLQGLVIFVFHCVLNKQIQTAVRQVRRKYSVTTSSDNITPRSKSKDTHSTV